MNDTVSRRTLLSVTAALAHTAMLGWPLSTHAQETNTASEPDPTTVQKFSFDILTEEMKQLATKPHVPAPTPEGFLGDLSYDDYRLIRFRDDHARWANEDSRFQLAVFHMGWLFREPVRIFEVTADSATEMQFSTDDFEYLNDLAKRVPEHAKLPGVAGFRLNTQLNRPDKWDELAAFVGASYFRALGRNSAYGLSARGLALNTATYKGEEFPRFSRFYMERRGTSKTIILYATLEGPSVTGAYRFLITPGSETVMEVTCRLFFRQDVAELGIAPLTSMFLFSEKNRSSFDDYRPNVHDSDGLRIERPDGDLIWRPLNNPSRLTGSYFAETAPRRFGLHQRNRDFESYQDIGARYERRPSLDVEPIGDWGVGHVRLVEIPSDLETNDNIVAYWVPEVPVKAGDSREFSYRLHWGDLPSDPTAPLAIVYETRASHGGISGVKAQQGSKKFVVDFKGGMLAELEAGAPVKPIITITNGELKGTTLEKIANTDIWRLVIDISAKDAEIVELGAHIAGYDRKLTETWLYQWINAK